MLEGADSKDPCQEPLSPPTAQPEGKSRAPDTFPAPAPRTSLSPPSPGPAGTVCHLDLFSPPQSTRHSLRASRLPKEARVGGESRILLSCEHPCTRCQFCHLEGQWLRPTPQPSDPSWHWFPGVDIRHRQRASARDMRGEPVFSHGEEIY